MGHYYYLRVNHVPHRAKMGGFRHLKATIYAVNQNLMLTKVKKSLHRLTAHGLMSFAKEKIGRI